MLVRRGGMVNRLSRKQMVRHKPQELDGREDAEYVQSICKHSALCLPLFGSKSKNSAFASKMPEDPIILVHI